MASTLDISLPLNRLESGTVHATAVLHGKEGIIPKKQLGVFKGGASCCYFAHWVTFCMPAEMPWLFWSVNRMHFIFIWWDDSISRLRSLPNPQRTVEEKKNTHTHAHTHKKPTKLLILSPGNCNCFIKESFEKSSSSFLLSRHLTLQWFFFLFHIRDNWGEWKSNNSS